jgi:hypothetical protein
MRTRTLFALTLSLLVSLLHASAQDRRRGDGFSEFKLIRSRNIFDPNRRAPRNTERRTDSRRPDSFTLTGTMVTDTKTLAFFSGTRSEYSRVIPVGSSVGPFKVKTIAAAQVELERDGKVLTLPMGRTLQLENASGASAPEVVDTPPPTEAPPEGSGPSDAPPTGSISSAAPPGSPVAPSNGSSAPPGDKNEVLRRMMERRQKEMSK